MKVITTQSFSKNVCKLIIVKDVSCRDDLSMKFVAYKMAINFYMLCSFVKNLVVNNVKGCFFIAIKFHELRIWNTEILKKHFEPKKLTSGCCHYLVFSFSWRLRNSCLLLYSPWERAVAKCRKIASCRSTSNRTTLLD